MHAKSLWRGAAGIVVGSLLVGLVLEATEATEDSFETVVLQDRAANIPARLDHPEHPRFLDGPPALQHAALSTGVSTGTFHQVIAY